MGRTLTNNTAFNYCIESSIGTASSTWYEIEVNEVGAWGSEISTVSRNPISANRQRRKGTTTDLDSTVELEADLTLSAFRQFTEGFCFATAVNYDMVGLLASAVVDTDNDTYVTTDTLTTDQATKLDVDTLIWAEGFTNTENNGLKSVSVATIASDSDVPVNETLVDEASPPSTARISLVGHRMAAGDTPSWTWSAGSSQATLALTGVGTELQALGLTAGQTVHIGSISSSTSTTIQNAFENAAANDMYGWARVKEFTDANTVVFDKVDAALQYTDATIATAVDILFSEFVRNVSTTDSDFLERSFQFEAAFANLGSGGGTEYEYAKGNYCNTMTFELPLADKATLSFGFIGTDTDPPVAAASRKSGASSATSPNYTSAYNSTADIARLRITDTDETGLTTDFKALSITFNNNVSPEKILGTLGAAYMNYGNFEVDVEAQMLFSNGDVIDRIRNNTTVTMDFIIKNDDGCISVDIPSITLGGGSRDFPENESILVDTTAMAFQDATLGTSIGVSILPVPIP